MIKYRVNTPSGYIETLTYAEAELKATAEGIPLSSIETIEEDIATDVSSKELLRIYSLGLVHHDFVSLPPSKLDFVRHLIEGITLKKDVEMAKNGRPIKAVYSYEGSLIAEILFLFETDPMNFLTRRTEKLGYYDINGIIPQHYVISDWVRNPTSQYDTTYITKERKEARIMIFDEIKSKLNFWIYTYYTPQGKTYSQILDIGGNFWTEFSNDIDSWINTGGKSSIQTKLYAPNIETSFTFLISEVAPGVTVRDYILDRINY